MVPAAPHCRAWRRRLGLAVLSATLLAWRPAGAEDSARAALAARYPELHSAIYDATVCEYCGLISDDVADGFRRQMADLVARDRLDEQAVRQIRISAWTKADLEWHNRGLGGFRNWCRSEGVTAALRFVAYHEAPAPDAADQE